MHEALRRALAAHVVAPDDDPASPNFSLQVADDVGGRRAKDFHLLHRGVTPVVRTRNLRRLVDGLLGYLSAAVERHDDDVVRLDELAFVSDGAAVLAPGTIRQSLASIERRLNAKGLRVVDRPWSCVDLTTGELVVPEPQLDIDRSALAGLGTTDAVAPGHYPIVGWGFGAGQDQQGAMARAFALTLAGARLMDRPRLDPAATLEGLARVMGRVRPVGLWAERPEGLVGQLVVLARSSTA